VTERHQRDGGQRDVAKVGKNWWGGAKCVAKKEVEVCKHEEPLICQQFPCLSLEEKEKPRGMPRCQVLAIKEKHSKMLKDTQLHGNSSSLLNFTQFHSTCFSLGLISCFLFCNLEVNPAASAAGILVQELR